MLFGKTRQMSRETEFYKILLVDTVNSETIGSVNLSVWASYRLLSMDSAHDLQLD